MNFQLIMLTFNDTSSTQWTVFCSCCQCRPTYFTCIIFLICNIYSNWLVASSHENKQTLQLLYLCQDVRQHLYLFCHRLSKSHSKLYLVAQFLFLPIVFTASDCVCVRVLCLVYRLNSFFLIRLTWKTIFSIFTNHAFVHNIHHHSKGWNVRYLLYCFGRPKWYDIFSTTWNIEYKIMDNKSISIRFRKINSINMRWAMTSYVNIMHQTRNVRANREMFEFDWDGTHKPK